MLGTIRYKDVRNTTGAVFTASNFPNFTDGDDKQKKEVKRTLSAIDVGTAPGQTQSTIGVILDVIPSSYDVLSVVINVSRPIAKVGNSTPYRNLNAMALPIPDPLGQVNILWYVDSDNCLRLLDDSETAATQLDEDDVIIAFITMGQRDSALDVINPKVLPTAKASQDNQDTKEVKSSQFINKDKK